MGEIHRMPRPYTVGELRTLLEAFPAGMPILLTGDGNQIIGLSKQAGLTGEHLLLETRFIFYGLGARDG
jgi:hypothetical protein